MSIQPPCRLLPRAVRHSYLFASTPSSTTTSRLFSSSPVQNADKTTRIRAKKTPTRERRKMYQFLNGPGAAWVEPRFEKYHYLGEYMNLETNELYLPDAMRSVQDLPKQTEVDGNENDAEGREDETTTRGKGLKRDERGPIHGDPDNLVDDMSLHPFPRNEHFVSQSVLSDELRQVIWRKVVKDKESVSAVSAELGVDMRRVGAVVRLVEVERKWKREGKPFAQLYASYVLDMLPQTSYNPEAPYLHETINDLPIHAATQQQIFYPTSESRRFTRKDAAAVFSPTLLPADARIPHPELIEIAKPEHANLKPSQRDKIAQQARATMAKEKAERDQKRKEWEQRNVRVVQRPKWEFRFHSIQADRVGRNGRHPHAVGWRYGIPHQDRKRGHMKGVPQQVLT